MLDFSVDFITALQWAVRMDVLLFMAGAKKKTFIYLKSVIMYHNFILQNLILKF